MAEDQKPTFIADDPRIGCKARRVDGTFSGVIESVMRFPDGYELLSIRKGALSNGGLEPSQVVIEQGESEAAE